MQNATVSVLLGTGTVHKHHNSDEFRSRSLPLLYKE